MKILLVDDNADKLDTYSSIINDSCCISDSQISVAPDLKTAKIELKKNKFNLMILDIQLPERFGEKPCLDGGIKFIELIKDSAIYNMPDNIIVVTAFQDSYINLEEKFNNNMIQMLQSSEFNLKWKDQLKAVIERVDRASATQHTNSHDYDVAIITALKEKELDIFLTFNLSWKRHVVNNDSSIYYIGEIINSEGKKLKVVAATADKMGVAVTASLATKVTHLFKPRYLIMLGIAAGLDSKNQNYGDILIAEKTWNYEAGKYISSEDGNSKHLPEPDILHGDIDLINKLKGLGNSLSNEIYTAYKHPHKPQTLPMIHIGPVVSGSAVRADGKVVNEILGQHRKAIGLEMETYGLYIASQVSANPRPKVISAKSITDFADKEKNDNYHHYAAFTSCYIVEHIIKYFCNCND